MATLIIVRNSGRRIGQCDSKCHKARGPLCNCVCGGANHGVGSKQALANMRAVTLERTRAWIRKVDPEGSGHSVWMRLPMGTME